MNETPTSDSSATTVVAGPAVTRDEDSLYAEFQSEGRPGQAVRAWLDAVREDLARRHFAGAGGMEIVREYTACLDRMVRALYRYADHHHSRRFSRLNQRLRGHRARRLRPRRAQSAIRHRSPLPARLQARPLRRGGDRDNSARAVGRRSHGRPGGAQRARMRACGQRRSEGEDRDPRYPLSRG